MSSFMTPCSSTPIIRVAAYAKKHLEIARDFHPLPKHANRAMLLGSECEYYLKALQEVNFDVFDPTLRKNSHLKVPYMMYKHTKKGTF
jgi:hypothetical protein